VAATENDTVYGLDAASGCVRWREHLGDPVDARHFPCGNIFTLGVTSTPAIVPETGTVYLVAYERPGRHELIALDLITGRTRFRRPVDPPGSHPLDQLQRPALAIANGRVYVAFGGRAGDCGDYRGYLVGARLDGGGDLEVFQTAGAEAAIWAPPGPTVLDGGDLLVGVGNGPLDSRASYDGGNAVVRLTPDLHRVDFFAAPNWPDLNRLDYDLGSVGPPIVDGGLVYQSGKDAHGYLLDAGHLGGIGGQRYDAPLGVCYAIGGTAYLSPYVYVPCDHGMKAVRVEGGRFSVAWTAPDFRSGSPIVAGGVVWNIDFEGGYLWGFDPASGRVLAKRKIAVANHFVSPSASAGRLFVPDGTQLLAFRMS
jgi:outer membrane protein assembly factor BamB